MDIAVVTSSVGSKETEAFVLEPHLSMSDQVALIPSTPKTVRQGGVQRNKGTYTDTLIILHCRIRCCRMPSEHHSVGLGVTVLNLQPALTVPDCCTGGPSNPPGSLSLNG